MIKVFFVFFAMTLVSASIGFDTSAGPFTANNISCLKTNGYTFAIFRGFRSYGVIDPNAVKNINAAHAGGIDDVGVYMTPCVECGNFREQVIDMVNGLKNANYNSIWLVIDPLMWGLNKATNRIYVQELMNEASKHGKSVGFYANLNSWGAVVGNDWTNGSKYFLWWDRWDKNPIMNFEPFAGWKTAKIKQYDGNRIVCGVKVNNNFKP